MKKLALISTSAFFISLTLLGAPPDKTALGGSWLDADNWSPTGVPGDDQNILIPVGVTQTNYGQYIEMDNSILVIRGTLSMESSCDLCVDYGQIVFTGENGGVIIEDGGTVRDDTAFGGSTHYIQAGEPPEKAWSGDFCFTGCGTITGTYTSTGETAWPSSLQNPLPVEFLFFEAHFENGEVMLEWATATEVTNDRFEVERSVDGEYFSRIGQVQGHGDSKERIDYNYIDKSIGVHAFEGLYYRLRQVDFDGKFDYSKMVMVPIEMAQSELTKISPNPFDSSLTINLIAGQDEEIRVDIYDLDGRNLFSALRPIVKGVNSVDVNYLDRIPKGIYLLNIIGTDFAFSERIAKNN